MAAADGCTDGARRRLCPALVGPTGVGKTDLVLHLARRYPIEVISLDSRQVYHGLRIGTAQPTAAEQAACRHHLVDFLAPTATYSAQRFRDDFAACWLEITARGKLPVLVGGAGFYLRAVTHGLFTLPSDHPQRLAEVRADIATLDDQALAEELSRVDPTAAARLHPHDRYRRARALEISRLAGRPASDLARGQSPDPALGLAVPLVRLERPVADLDARIRRRVEAMLTAGWVEETRGLLAEHPADCPGLRSLGYAEIVGLLQGRLTPDQLVPAITLATRQYAKRQRTWFRRLEVQEAGAPAEDAVVAALSQMVERGLALLDRP